MAEAKKVTGRQLIDRLDRVEAENDKLRKRIKKLEQVAVDITDVEFTIEDETPEDLPEDEGEDDA